MRRLDLHLRILRQVHTVPPCLVIKAGARLFFRRAKGAVDCGYMFYARPWSAVL